MNLAVQISKEGAALAPQPARRRNVAGLATLGVERKNAILAHLVAAARADVVRYLDAVRADLYRITVLRFPEPPPPPPEGVGEAEEEAHVQAEAGDNKTKSFIFGRSHGHELHTAAQVLASLPQLLRLDASGENIYLTPISDAVHHILVDDIDIAKLGRMVAAGFQPCFVLQSSSTSWQALLNVKKLGVGVEHERDRLASNALMIRLNRTLEFGDPEITGGVHPHRLPCTHNWKPDRRLLDGSRYVVRLLKAEARQCPKSLELLQQIDSEFLAVKLSSGERCRAPRGGANNSQGPAASGTLDGAAEVVSSEAVQRAASAYAAHRHDILSRHSGDIDESRADFMIAVRLRVTGHSRAAIRDAIREVGLDDRAASSMHSNWPAYCQRTANSAWGPQGDSGVNHLAARWQAVWERLERKGRPRGGLY